MAIEKPPSGSRGVRTGPKILGRIVMPLMVRVHRRSHDQFKGMSLLYLTTVGAKSGKQRTVPTARFDQPDGSWVICASAGGAAAHPGWYHNLAAHPDQVWAEVGGRRSRVEVEQLSGERRERAWEQIVREAPGFGGYLEKTDRQLPVLRLTPLD